MSTQRNVQCRPWRFERHYTRYAEGSVFVHSGHTKVLCNVSVTEGVPRFLKGSGQGWLTAEYSMLPRSTHDRMQREATRGKQGGRTLEIQRLIGRSLRAAIDLKALGENTLAIDCDVIQADGGTRTAAISGSMVAVVDALRYLQRKKIIQSDPLKTMIAAVSVGIHQGQVVLDLDYEHDASADTDMNVVMNEEGGFIEIQGTAEAAAFSGEQLTAMLDAARAGIGSIIQMQKEALTEA